MFTSFVIITLIIAVTGRFFVNKPICEDFFCWDQNIKSEWFRICQEAGCYNEFRKPYLPPVAYSPPPPPPFMPTPEPKTNNMIPLYYGPGPSPPMMSPPMMSSSPIPSFPPMVSPPPGPSSPPMISPPPIPSPPMMSPPPIPSFPPMMSPPPGPYSPPLMSPSPIPSSPPMTSPPPIPSPPMMFPPPIPSFPPMMSPPPGPSSPPMMSPSSIPSLPMMYPSPAPSIPPPTAYPTSITPPYYNPGPSFPPMMSLPTIPSLPMMYPSPAHSIPAPTAYPTSMTPPYYDPASYFMNHWYSQATQPPKVGNIPAPIQIDTINDTQVIKDGLTWPGWEIVMPNEYSNVTDISKNLNKTYGTTQPKRLQLKDSQTQKILYKLRAALKQSATKIALEKWFEKVGSSNNFAFFMKWINNFENPQSQWPHQKKNWLEINTPTHQNNYYIPPLYSDPFQAYYQMNGQLSMPTTNDHYMNWLTETINPYMNYDFTFPYMYQSLNKPYFQQEMLPFQPYYPNKMPEIVNPISPLDNKPALIVDRGLNITVIFDVREFNVSICKATVSMPYSPTLKNLLRKAKAKNDCFKFTPDNQTGKYLYSMNGIKATKSSIWKISKTNEPTELSLDYKPNDGDYIIINNIST